MKWAFLFAAWAGLAAVTACAPVDRQSSAETHTRKIAFDNVYGNVDKVPVHVSVDAGAERRATATCDAKTCTFELPLTNARHDLVISVEQKGQRSAPTRVTLDTSDLP